VITDYAAAGRSYASHVSFYQRNSALQAATATPEGMLVRIGGNGGHGMPLLVPMDQWKQFKSTFGAKTDE
jgi:hypothetical protein